MTKFFSKVLLRPYYVFVHLCKYLYRRSKFKEYHWSNGVASLKMIKPQFVSLGECARIGNNARIEGVSRWNNMIFDPLIIIGKNTSIQQDVHITCARRILIGANTAIAARVTITDINHPYKDISLPIDKQDIEVEEVVIGEDCKIYNGAVILPGVHIGKHCVIGANSVVNINIPDYSVAVGMPARIVKRYDFEKQEWRKTEKDGSFIN